MKKILTVLVLFFFFTACENTNLKNEVNKASFEHNYKNYYLKWNSTDNYIVIREESPNGKIVAKKDKIGTLTLAEYENFIDQFKKQIINNKDSFGARTDYEKSKNNNLIVIIAIVLVLLIALYFLNQSGSTTKKGREKNKLDYKLKNIEKDISELKIIHHKGIIDEQTLAKKQCELQSKKREILVEYYLEKDEKYKSLIRAYQKGFITETQKAEKLSQIKDRIKNNIR